MAIDPNVPAIANAITGAVDNWNGFITDQRNWSAGTANGGVLNDGVYPLRNSLGVAINLPSPAKLVAMTTGPMAQAVVILNDVNTAKALVLSTANTVTQQLAWTVSNAAAAAGSASTSSSWAANSLVQANLSIGARNTAQAASNAAVAANTTVAANLVLSNGVLTSVNAANTAVQQAKTDTFTARDQAQSYASSINPSVIYSAITSNVATLNASISGKTNVGHTHEIANVASLQTTLDNKLTAYPGIATSFGAFQINSLGIDSAQGDGLLNIVSGAVHAHTANASVGGHNFTSTARGAVRLGLHDSVFNVYVANTITGVAGQSVGWQQAMAVSNTSVNMLFQPQFNGVNLTSATDLATGLATKQNSLGFTAVQQGTGVGQLSANLVKIGWSTPGRLKATVDGTDLGNVVFDSNLTWANVIGKPTTFAPSAHTHTTSEVTGLDTALGSKAPTANPTFSGTVNIPTLNVTSLTTTPVAYIGTAGTMSGTGVAFDVSGTSFRIYERAGSFRGVTVDLAGCGSQSALWHSSNFDPNTKMNVGGGTFTGNVQFPAGVYVGSGVATGLYGDTGSIALRGYGSNVLYFQSQGGAATYGTWNATALNVYAPAILNSGATITGAASVSGAMTVGTNVRASNTGGTGQFTAVNGSTMAGFYNDGSQFYILKHATSNAAFDGHRPFFVNLSTGQVQIDSTGASTTVVGGGLQVGQSLRSLQGVDGTTMAATGFGVRVRARSDNATGILQFTDTGATAQWTSLYSNGSGQLRSSTMFGVDGEFYANSWMRSATSGTGWYHEVHGGGWMMQDSTYVRCYGDKTIYTGGGVLSAWVQAGTVTATSDRRFKSNIRALEPVAGLVPMRFVKDGKERLGYIAQDVQATVAKDAVHDQFGADGEHSLSLEPLAMLAAVHAQLEARIAALEARP
jgi:hypothetical protein